VATFPARGNAPVSALWWSPDGTRLAVRYDDDPGAREPRQSIRVLRWDGAALTAAPGEPGAGSAPRWGPAGDPVVLLTGDRARAEDIVHDAFVALHRPT
jgi:dipeptidyl aminopeptidase/acylaminoacyl peptidase